MPSVSATPRPAPGVVVLLLLLAVGLVAPAGAQQDVQAFALPVPVDHFNAQVRASFRVHYFVNAKFRANASSPVLYYVGGDQAVNGNEIATAAAATSLPATAAALGALLVAAEPRYYGQSLPFGPEPTPAQLGYLSMEQTLADHAAVIRQVQRDFGVEGPVFAVGTSYGGVLAAALRTKYAHLVWGAQASSAPVNVDGSDPAWWFQAVSEVFQNQSQDCGPAIRRGWQDMLSATQTADGRAALTQAFRLCSALPGDADSVLRFQYWARLAFSWVAQFNFPYPTMFQAPAAPAPHLCGLATTQPGLAGLGEAVVFGWNWTYAATPCMNVTDQLLQPTVPLVLKYMACTQLLAPMASNGRTDLFSDLPFNLTATNAQCLQWFNTTVDPTYIADNYGGANLGSASRIAFTNGLYDPTRVYSIQQSLSPSIPAFTAVAAHSQDLYPETPLDDPSLVQLRAQMVETFRTWYIEG